MIWAAVTSGFGRFVRGESWAEPIDGPGTLRLSLSDDGRNWRETVAVNWPSEGRALRVAFNDARVLAVAKTQTPGDLIIGNDLGRWTLLGPTHGESCCGVEALPDGRFRVGAVVSSLVWRTWLVDGETLVATLESEQAVPDGWADGWVDFKNAVPQWVPEHRGWKAGGHQLGIWGTWGGYIVGQSYIAPGIDAINAASGELLRVCDGDSPVQPHAAELDGRIVVAFSADAPQFVCSDDFKPAPEKVIDPVRVPDFPDCQHVMAMSFADDPEAPDWSEFCTLGRDDIHEAIARAKARKVPLVGYWDRHEFDVDTVATGAAIALAAGVRFIPQAMFYPKPNESAETFRARIEPTAREMQRRWPDDWAAYGAAYRQWNGVSYPLGLQQVLDCQRVTYDVCRQFKARVLTWFAWRRPDELDQPVVDGVLMFPELQESARRLKSAVSTRHQFPKQHAASAPQKPPTMPTTPPAHARLDLPDYLQFIAESREVQAAYVQAHGIPPAASDLFHNYYRRLSQGWTHAQILGDLRGEPRQVEFIARLPWQPEYEQFIGWAAPIWQAYVDANGRPPAESDMAHNAWRLLVERYSFSKVIAGIGGTVPAEVQGTPATSANPERVSGAALLDVKGNFCNLRDAKNRIVYTPGLTGAPADVYDEWMQTQRDNGSTHIPFGPPIGGAAYPGMSWANPDFWSDLPAFRAFIEKVLDTPAADGKGFRPIVFIGGDTFDQSRFDRWPELAAALEGLHEFLILVPGWECIPQEGWTSNQYAKALRELKRLFPSSKLAAHMQPTRWAFSSNPVEADDPWQGGESECYKSHGGEGVELVLYQTPHGRELYRPCTCPDSPKGQFTHAADCWLDRFEDGVSRLGDGYHGWRKLKVVLFESVAFEAYRGQATPDHARDIATAAKKVGDKWGVHLGFGNGLPR